MKKLTQEEFIARASVSNLKLDLSRVQYKNSSTKVLVICKKHSVSFWMNPRKVLEGQTSCPHCAGVKLSNEEFIRRAKLVHGDSLDFSGTHYVRMSQKVSARCVKHGRTFTQFPQALLKGLNGCPECNGQSAITRDEFIEKARMIHSGYFDYSLIKDSDVKNHHSKVRIKCVKDGEEFVQEIASHLRGANGCPVCGTGHTNLKKVHEKVSSIYPDRKFDYSQVDFAKGMRLPVKIGCSVEGHGTFEQTLDGHLSGRIGCKKCAHPSVSQMENDLADYVSSLGVNVVRNDRKVLKGREIDILVPDKRLGIEFNGLYWHSEQAGKDRNYHFNKWNDCKNAGIQLITVWEDDWRDKKSIVKSLIAHKLNVASERRVFARKTTFSSIARVIAGDFLNRYHIQGDMSGIRSFSLNDDAGKPVAVMSFSIHGDTARLERYATSCSVVGGFTKLLEHSIGELPSSVSDIITFSDNSVSDGGLYRNNGFIQDGIIKPDYSYVRNDESGFREHKFNYRIARFRKDDSLLFEENKTERELAKLNNLLKVWDCGKVRWRRVLPSSD